jgi:DNA-binding MarR family transcriptional regulator
MRSAIMHKPLERLLIREKPALALLAVEEMESAYAAIVAKRIDSTFPHTSSILSQLEDLGLIKARPEGRVRYLQLTERGKRVANALRELCLLLKEPKEQLRNLERLRPIASSESKNPLRIGPLRRDLAKLRSGGDEEIRLAAEELDGLIVAALQR